MYYVLIVSATNRRTAQRKQIKRNLRYTKRKMQAATHTCYYFNGI